MAEQKTDKRQVLIMLGFCALVIIAPHFIFYKQTALSFKSFWFSAVDFTLVGAFISQAIGSYIFSEDPNKEWKRGVVIALACAVFLWTCGWAAYFNELV